MNSFCLSLNEEKFRKAKKRRKIIIGRDVSDNDNDDKKIFDAELNLWYKTVKIYVEKLIRLSTPLSTSIPLFFSSFSFHIITE